MRCNRKWVVILKDGSKKMLFTQGASTSALWDAANSAFGAEWVKIYFHPSLKIVYDKEAKKNV